MRPDRAALPLALALAWATPACSGDDDPGPAADAGGDAPDAAPDAGARAPAPPAAPQLEPCPEGWRVVPNEVPLCAPAPDSPPDCPDDEAFFPGAAGCAPVGVPCPADDFAEDLPAGRVVWYVRAGAPEGGDGSLGAPFATIADGIDAASAGDVVAVSRGTFVEAVVLPEGVTLQGACPAETRLATDRAVGSAGVVTVAGSDAGLADVTLVGPGPGLWVEGRDASLSVSGVVIAGTDFAGIVVGGGGELTGRSVLVRDVESQPVPGVSGVGALVDTGGLLELERVSIEQTGGTAVVALGTEVILRDAALRDGVGEDPPARGIEAQLGARVELVRLWMDENRGAAIVAFDMDTEIQIEDAWVAGTGADAEGHGGRGLSLVDGARATVRRATFTGQHEVAVIADEAPSAVILEDVVVGATFGREADLLGGSGLSVQSGATATLTRVALAESRGAGLLAIGEGTVATLADVWVPDTFSLDADGDQGTGLHVQGGAAVTGVRVRVTRNHQAGLIAIAGATVALEDLEIADTRERECAAGGWCSGVGFGDGVISSLGAAVELRRFRIAGSARVGVTVADGALDLHEGEVSGCPIGASVQTEGFDVERLYDDVVFRDNDRNLDRSLIGVPEPVSGF